MLPADEHQNKAELEHQNKVERLADDLLSGAAEIAEFLGTTPTAVYHLAKRRRLPIGKLGKNLFASKSKLRRAAAALTGTAA